MARIRPGAPGAWPECVPRVEGEPGARRLVEGSPLSCTHSPSPGQQEFSGLLPRSQRQSWLRVDPRPGLRLSSRRETPVGGAPRPQLLQSSPQRRQGSRGLPCTAGQGPAPLHRIRPSHGLPEGWRPCCPPGCRTSLEATPSCCAARGPAPRLQGRSSQCRVTGWGPVLPFPGPWGAATALRV